MTIFTLPLPPPLPPPSVPSPTPHWPTPFQGPRTHCLGSSRREREGSVAESAGGSLVKEGGSIVGSSRRERGGSVAESEGGSLLQEEGSIVEKKGRSTVDKERRPVVQEVGSATARVERTSPKLGGG